MKLFPSEISRPDGQLKEIPAYIRREIVPGFRCLKVVSELVVQVLSRVTGERQITECNSFHADMDGLDKRVCACLSIDVRGKPDI